MDYKRIEKMCHRQMAFAWSHALDYSKYHTLEEVREWLKHKVEFANDLGREEDDDAPTSLS